MQRFFISGSSIIVMRRLPLVKPHYTVAEIVQMVKQHKPKFKGSDITNWVRLGNITAIQDPHYDSGHGKYLIPVAGVEHVLLRTGGFGKTYSTNRVYQELKKRKLGIAPPKIVQLIKDRKIQGIIIRAKTSTSVLITQRGLNRLIKILLKEKESKQKE